LAPSAISPGPSWRRALLPAIATLAIGVAIVFAVAESLQTGRLYLFSSQFFEDLARRFTGPGRFRFILQPALAIALGVRGGLADVREGNQPFVLGLLFDAERRGALLRSGAAAIRDLVAMGITLDVLFQWVLFRSIHPGAALLVGPILIGVPYAVARALANRLTRAASA